MKPSQLTPAMIRLMSAEDRQAFGLQDEQADHQIRRLRSMQPQPAKRLPLDTAAAGEETRWHGPAERLEITFTVHAVRPCDWDGYDIKALQDFCVTAGIIPADGWKTLSGRVRSCKAATKADEKTVIQISDGTGDV